MSSVQGKFVDSFPQKTDQRAMPAAGESASCMLPLQLLLRDSANGCCLQNLILQKWIYGEFTSVLHTARFTFYIAPLQYKP